MKIENVKAKGLEALPLPKLKFKIIELKEGNMFKNILIYVIGHLIDLLSPNIIKQGVDAFLDTIEKAVKNSENNIDDAIILPLIEVVRSALNVPQDTEIN